MLLKIVVPQIDPILLAIFGNKPTILGSPKFSKKLEPKNKHMTAQIGLVQSLASISI